MSQATKLPKPHTGEWLVQDLKTTPIEVHVYPTDDSMVHHLTDVCWCDPERDHDEGNVVIHNRRRDELS